MYNSLASYETLKVLADQKLIKLELIFKRLSSKDNCSNNQRKFIAVVFKIKMNKLNYSIKIVDNFLNKEDFNYLCTLHQDTNFENEFKVYHNEINNDSIINSSIDHNFLKKIHNNYFSKAMNILNEICPEKQVL